jgi:hypothetical protein
MFLCYGEQCSLHNCGVQGCDIRVDVHQDDSQFHCVTLHVKSPDEEDDNNIDINDSEQYRLNINALLVERGLARCTQRLLGDKDLVQLLLAKQDSAKQQRVGDCAD